jgi:formate--tetrahydrofolate ligase
VAALADGKPKRFKPLYNDDMPLMRKLETIATEIYGASEVAADRKVRDQLAEFEAAGHGNLPICVAKTQYSFSADPSVRGAPTGHILPVREVRLSAGAGFVVAICGDIMTMPGLPKSPAAERIGLSANGEIEGLF